MPLLVCWSRGRDALLPLRFREAPMLLATGCFAAGIVLAEHPRPAVLLLGLASILLLLSVAALRVRTGRIAVAPVAVLWIAAGMLAAELQPGPPVQRALLPFADGLSRTVRGHVLRVRDLPAPEAEMATDQTWDSDEELTHDSEARSIDLQVDAVEEVTPDVSRMIGLAAPAGVRIAVPAGISGQVACGDAIEAPMRLKLPERYRDPGAWQYADYLAGQGITARANVRTLTRLPPAGRGVWSSEAVRCDIFAVQGWASGRLLRFVHSGANQALPAAMRMSADDAGMINAMLDGDRSRLNRQTRSGFERTGSFHLFVVSGLHIGLAAAGLFWMGRRLRLNEFVTTIVTILLTAAYAAVTGFGAPVQRALGMTAVFLIARLWSRERNALNALGAAALAALVWTPESLFEAGFQMTFLAIVAIAGIALPLGERSFLAYARTSRRLEDLWLDANLKPQLAQMRVMLRLFGEACAGVAPRPRLRLRRMLGAMPAALVRVLFWTLELVLIGAVTELVMVLPMAIYFHRATVFALPANLLSVPVVAVLMPLATVTFAASCVSQWLALVPAAATALLLHGVTTAVGHLSHLQGADWRVPAPATPVIAMAAATLLLCCWAVRRSGRWAAAATVALPAIALLVLWPEPPSLVPQQLEVTALDVGQGDSMLIAGPSGETMLVDAGGPTGAAGRLVEQSASSFDVGEEVVSNYLWSRRIRRLDIVVLTHAHSDHMGGMPAVLRNLRPRELWVSIDPHSAAYQDLLAEAASLGIAVRHLHAGDRPGWGEVAVSVLAPAAGYDNAGAPGNNDSLVLQLDYGKASVLLEGDAEAASERAMLTAGIVAPVTLLKVGHHGSRTSSGAAFVEAAAPRDAVLSAGRGNPFGHPRPEVVGRFADAHVKLFRTDEFGLTTFLLTPDGGIHESVGVAEQPRTLLPW